MINRAEIRQRVERAYIRGENPAEVLGDIPEDWRHRLGIRIERALEDDSVPSLSSIGRRMNNFCVGSDPEFAFARVGRASKVAAAELGLKPALAAGCDQNQRLAELRGWPTRSVVEHVAGILASLRWMYRLYPYTRDFQWRAGAFFDGDGLGGHVHFGRKRPSRKEEIAGLDGVTKVFKAINCFDNRAWDLRIHGDSRNQRYGDYGDFRLQLHGYEYRTHPSWLCSPLKAFFVLSVSKLAIYDPDLVAGWYQRSFTSEQGLEVLRRLALYYSGRDDDAWILKYLLSRKDFAKTVLSTWGKPYADFKPHWGFTPDTVVAQQKSQILAACVAPHTTEVQEIADLLLKGTTLRFREVEPTFRNTLPTNYRWLYGEGWASGLQNGGAGDLTHNLVAHVTRPVQVNVGSSGVCYVSSDLWNTWTSAERDHVQELFPSFRVTGDKNNFVMIDRSYTGVDGIRKSKQFLLGGLFPLWTVNGVQADSFDKWELARRAALVSEKTKTAKAPRRQSSLERVL